MPTTSYRSFTGGEISKSLHARVDLAKYQNGLATCRNFIVRKSGGLTRRPGSEFINYTKNGDDHAVRLIPWHYSDAQTHVLEFGHGYMRVLTNGAHATNMTADISGISGRYITLDKTPQAMSVRNNDRVIVDRVGGILNMNRTFIAKVSAYDKSQSRIRIYEQNGRPFVADGTWTGGGRVRRIFEMKTGYRGQDLRGIRFSQSDDVMTLTHDDYRPRQLRRRSATWWQDVKVAGGPKIERPYKHYTGVDVYSRLKNGWEGVPGWVRYQITTVNEEGDESTPETSKTFHQREADYTAICSAAIGAGGAAGVYLVDNATSVKVTWSATEGNRKIIIGGGMNTKDLFSVHGVLGDGTQMVEKLAGAELTVHDSDRTFGYLTTENYFSSVSKITTASDRTGNLVAVGLGDVDFERVDLAWGSVPSHNGKFITYNIYRRTDSAAEYGYIGRTSETAFTDLGFEADFEKQPPQYSNPFPTSSRNYDADFKTMPGVCGSFQQRLILGATQQKAQRLWLSATGIDSDFSFKNVLKDDDPFWFDAAGQRINRITHLLSLGKLVVFTESGEWVVNGDESGAITPTSINMQQHTHYGTGDLRPLEVGGDAIFVQPRGPVVRDLGYSYQSSGYKGNDLTAFADHLFRYNEIVDWTYQQGPDSIVWCVLGDGNMLGLTYLKEHNVFAWHRHDRDGEIESVCSIPERVGDTYMDAVYIAVKNVIDGKVVRYVERMSRTHYEDFGDYVYLDSSMRQSGWQGSRWTRGYIAQESDSARRDTYSEFPYEYSSADYTSLIADLVSGDAYFKTTGNSDSGLTSADVGSIIKFRWLDFRLEITEFINDYAVKVKFINEDGTYTAPTEEQVTDFTKVENKRADVWQSLLLSVENVSEGWETTGLLKIETGTDDFFSGVEIGDELWFRDNSRSDIDLRIVIKAHDDDKVAYGIPDRSVPTKHRGVLIKSWAIAQKTFSGFWHLEGEDVGIYGDGNVIASPNNASYPTATVTDGQITVPRPCATIVAGLPFTSDMELLDMDLAQGETLSDKEKIVNGITLHVDRAKGGFVGAKFADEESSIDGLAELKYDSTGSYEGAAQPRTGKYRAVIDNTWNSNGRAVLRQVDPLPMDIMAVHPMISVGSRRRTTR